MNLPTNLPTAKLPQTYETAKNALAQCSEVDECQQWADKAEALASYARQANDTTMRKLADRIQARAIRRAGELLKQYDARGDHLKIEGTHNSQKQAATDAGLSEYQTATAVRVANVPEEEFEQQVESDNPPTVTKLAEQGTKKRNIVDLGDIPPEHYARATELQGNLRRLSEFCAQHDARDIAKAFKPHEAAKAHEWINNINRWLDIFAVNLQEENDDDGS